MSTLLAINNYYYNRGGAETVFLAHNRMLEALGWNVVPFAMQHPNNLATPWSEYFVEEIELGRDYSLAENLVRVPKVIYSFEARRKLGKLIDRVAPDIAHAHNVYHHISPSILSLLKSRGIPTVLTLHDLKIACPAYTMLAPDGVCERCRGGRLYNVVLHRCVHGSAALSMVALLESGLHRLLGTYRRCVSSFVVPSRFYIDKFCEWGMERELFRHVPNFIDATNYEPRYAPGSHFLFFGRLTRQKGLATLIRAIVESGSSLAIAGTGPELAALRALAERLKANVTFLGHLSGAVLHEAVRDTRAVVLPSEGYENAPMSILEAYALGKPVIGARLGGIPELIRDEETGVCFASGNVASLAEALRIMAARTPAQIEAMGRAGRRWVEQAFTLEAYRQSMLAVYRDLGVNGSRPVSLPLHSPS